MSGGMWTPFLSVKMVIARTTITGRVSTRSRVSPKNGDTIAMKNVTSSMAMYSSMANLRRRIGTSPAMWPSCSGMPVATRYVSLWLRPKLPRVRD